MRVSQVPRSWHPMNLLGPQFKGWFHDSANPFHQRLTDTGTNDLPSGINGVCRSIQNAEHVSLGVTDLTFNGFYGATDAASPILGAENDKRFLLFDGVDDRLLSFISSLEANSLARLIDASQGEVIMAARPLALASAGSSALRYNNDCFFAAGGGYMGLFVTSTGILTAYNYDGTDDYADSASGVIVDNTDYVLGWRHQGGVVSAWVNGEIVASVSSGDTDAAGMALSLRLGSWTTQFAAIRIYAFIVRNVPFSDAERARVVAWMRQKIGV